MRNDHSQRRKHSLPSAVAALVVVFFTAVAASAQWATPAGTQNIYNTNTGNVGIGTDTPSSLLEVKKNHGAATTVTVDNPFTTSGSAPYSAFVLKQGGVNRLHIASVNDNHSFITAGTAQFWNFANAPTVFATNNTEQMRISADGNVGIGTNSPDIKLRVHHSSANNNIGNIQLADLAMGLRNTSNTNGALSIISFQDAAGYGNVNIAAIQKDQANHAGDLAFLTRTNTTTFGERMRITSTGSVGIGITAPLYSLDVNGGTNGFRTKASSVSANDTIATFENGSAIQMIVRANGNVGMGVTNPTNRLHVNGSITIENGNINAKYQDLAEWVESSQELAPGTVVIIDPVKHNQVIAATQAYDSRVAGVISLKPGIALGEDGEGRVLVATTGRVKVKVDATNGPIQMGDLLVTSEKEGVAMKSVPVEIGGIRIHRPGTLIGKALEPLAGGTGEILVLLSLQ